MFGQSKFVVRGVVLVFALLIYGTASADNNVSFEVERSIESSISDGLFVSSGEFSDSLANKPANEMEEVMVIGRQELVLPAETLIDKIVRFNSTVEYFPGLKQSSQVDRAPRFSLHAENEQNRFVEVFRVRFGGRG